MQGPAELRRVQRRAARGQAVLAWTTLVADLETPVSAMLKLADGRPMSFLLESVEGGEKIGRYSMIGTKPDLVWRCFGGQAWINRRARTDPDAFERAGEDALASLRALVAECHGRDAGAVAADGVGPVRLHGLRHGRAFGALPDTNPDTLNIPDGLLLRPTVIAIFDNIADTRHRRDAGLAAAPDLPPRAAYDHALRAAGRVIADLERNLPHRRESPDGGAAARARRQHDARAMPAHGRDGEGIYPRRRDLPGRALDALCACRSGSRPSRSTARCAASTPRHSCSSSITAASPSSARAPRSWCACATAR